MALSQTIVWTNVQDCVERTLLSAAFDFDFDIDLDLGSCVFKPRKPQTSAPHSQTAAP
jgi:hypothetical protein